MTVNLARLIFFDYFQNGHITGAWPLDPSADQGSVNVQDHGRESGVSRHARAGPHARRAGALTRARAHASPEWKCGPVGVVKPSALAVFRLLTSSNVVGCCIGRSAGFSPLRILPA